MQFISTHGEHQVVLRHRRVKVTQTSDQGSITEVIPGIRAKFQPLAEAFKTDLLPTKTEFGGARGMLDTANVAREYGVDEQEVIRMLMDHRSYGTSFVGIGDGGGLADAESKYITTYPDGSFECTLCDMHITTAQGLNGHKRSHIHRQNLADAEEQVELAS